MITDEDVLAVRCPRGDCARPAGSPCAYQSAPPGSGREIGDPMPHGHAERRKLARTTRDTRLSALRHSQMADRRRETLAGLDAAIAGRRADLRDITRAVARQSRTLTRMGRPYSRVIPLPRPAVLREYDETEFRAMQAWLAEYGTIFWEGNDERAGAAGADPAAGRGQGGQGGLRARPRRR